MKSEVSVRQSSQPHTADTSGGSTRTEHHISPLSTYFAVFGALLFFTVITVWVSTLGLSPTLSIVVAMTVAAIKATMVVMYFMHLKYGDRFYSFIFIASLLFVALFFTIVLTDMNSRTRSEINDQEDNFLIEKYENKNFVPNPGSGAKPPEGGAKAPAAEEKH